MNNMTFDGPAYCPSRDDARLSSQHLRVRGLMLDGAWRTLAQISTATGDPAPSVSAQLRHLRKARFGGFTVERQHVKDGLYIYRVLS
jgi:hypothetical protein